jgi:Mg-chelatase subunit ChlD
MLRSHRPLLFALSIFSGTCAHQPQSAPKSAGVRTSTAIATAEGDDDMADDRDLAIVTDDSSSVPEGVKDLGRRADREPASRTRSSALADVTTGSSAKAQRDKPEKPAAAPATPPPGTFIDHATGKRPRPPAVAEKPLAEPPADFRAAPAAPVLKAGRHDDNKEYNRFLAFLAQNKHRAVYSTDISERLLVRALDRQGHSLPNCQVAVKSASQEVSKEGQAQVLAQLTTYADGSTQFFPAAVSTPIDDSYVVRVICGGQTRNGQLARSGRRDNEIRFDFARKVPKPMPVDVAIVLDTTGSMQGQIDRLKQTLKAIHFQLTSLPVHPDIRFGMVAYRDKDDAYRTQVTPFTSNIESYQAMLRGLVADGGGDLPEDLQTALDVAMHQLKWRLDALRIGFIITDAPPHTNYGQEYNYLEAMKESLGRGIKWVTVGAGGLGIDGEVIYRQIAQYTMGEYVFITQGEVGDSEGGTEKASHHVGANYSTENLDQAIVRIVRRELSYLTDTPKDFDTTIVATGDKTTPRAQMLGPAVAETVRQLADYSSLKLGSKTRVAIVPVTCADAKLKSIVEYLTDQMILSASRNEFFNVVERDLTALTHEMKLQLSNLVDASAAVPIGRMLGAEVLIVSKLAVKAGNAELFAKLIRVETGEVLSVANARVMGGAGFVSTVPPPSQGGNPVKVTDDFDATTSSGANVIITNTDSRPITDLRVTADFQINTRIEEVSFETSTPETFITCCVRRPRPQARAHQHDRQRAGAAVADKRQGHADHGQKAGDHADVDGDLPEQHGGHAHAHGDAEAVARLAADLQDPQHQQAVGEKNGGAADEAPFLGPHGEGKIRPQGGQRAQADLRPLQKSLADEAARADGVHGLARLPGRGRIERGIDEGQHAVALVVVKGVFPQWRDGQRASDHDAAQGLHAQAGDDDDRRRDEPDDERGAEVGLSSDKQHRQPGEKQGYENVAQRPAVQRRCVVDVLGQRDDGHHLHQL